MLDRVRIWTLREAGHTLEEIASAVGVGKRSVRRILKEPPITSLESAPTPESRRIGRPSRVEALQGDVAIAYAIARRVSGERVIGLISEQPKWKAVYDALLGGGFWRTLGIVTLVRLPPNSPFAITNLVLAATGVRWLAYAIGTVVGIAPRTIAAVWIGWQLADLDLANNRQTWFFVSGIVALVAVIAIIGAIAKRALDKVTAMDSPIA